MRSVRRHDAVWAAGLVAGLAAFFFLVAGPQFGKARGLRESLREERRRVDEGRSDLEEVPRLQAEVNQLRRQVGQFDQQVPPRDHLGDYLERLAGAAERHGLRPDAIEPGAAVRVNELFAIPIVLRVHGPFKEVYGLLQDIERLPRLTRVERFDAKVAADRPGEVQSEMQLRVFYRSS